MAQRDVFEIPAEVEAALDRQDAALSLLERLRAEQPLLRPRSSAGGGRRDFRRWPTPSGVSLELHDGLSWTPMDCLDVGVGGARLRTVPVWVQGPAPARLTAPGMPGILVLADVMWKDREGRAGLRFEFHDEDERDMWSGALIDALLARHALS